MASFHTCVLAGSTQPLSVALATLLAFAPPNECCLIVVFVGDHGVAVSIPEAFDDVPRARTDGGRAMKESSPAVVEERPVALPDEEHVIFFNPKPLSMPLPEELRSVRSPFCQLRLRADSKAEDDGKRGQDAEALFDAHLYSISPRPVPNE